MWRAESFEKTLMLGKIEGRRRRGQQRMRWLDGIIDSMDMSLVRLRELVFYREAWHAAVHGVTKIRTRLSDWTELRGRFKREMLEGHTSLPWPSPSYVCCVLLEKSQHSCLDSTLSCLGLKTLGLCHTISAPSGSGACVLSLYPQCYLVPNIFVCVCWYH